MSLDKYRLIYYCCMSVKVFICSYLLNQKILNLYDFNNKLL